jgi:hypothetical protein
MDQIRALEPGPERGPEGPAWRAPGSAPAQTVWPPENGALEGEAAEEEVAAEPAAEPAEEPHVTNGLPEADPEPLDASNGSNMEAPVLDGRTPEGESMVWQLAESRQVTITLRSTGDQGRDAQRLRRIHGMLSSAPGGDHYSFLVYEASRCYHLEFPNSTTRYSLELHQLLMGLLGERAVQVEPLGLQ